MKNQTLSIEQMKHLKDLGVDVSKASMVLLFIGEDGEHIGWEVENHGMPGAEPLYEWWNEELEVWESTHKEYFDAETGSYDHSFREDCGVFTLQDMIEMMPKSIVWNNKEYGFALYSCHDDKTFSMQYVRDDGYEGTNVAVFKEGEILVECCVSMVGWLVKNNHFNKEYLKGGKP